MDFPVPLHLYEDWADRVPVCSALLLWIEPE